MAYQSAKLVNDDSLNHKQRNWLLLNCYLGDQRHFQSIQFQWSITLYALNRTGGRLVVGVLMVHLQTLRYSWLIATESSNLWCPIYGLLQFVLFKCDQADAFIYRVTESLPYVVTDIELLPYVVQFLAGSVLDGKFAVVTARRAGRGGRGRSNSSRVSLLNERSLQPEPAVEWVFVVERASSITLDKIDPYFINTVLLWHRALKWECEELHITSHRGKSLQILENCIMVLSCFLSSLLTDNICTCYVVVSEADYCNLHFPFSS